MPIILASMCLASMVNSVAFAQNVTTTTQEQNPQLQSLSLNQTADVNQIKQYLKEAITALDNGNNTKAAEQIELADKQLETLAGADADDKEVEGEGEEDDNEEVEGELEEESETEEKSAGQS